MPEALHPNTSVFDQEHMMETFHQLELVPMEPRKEIDPTGRDAHSPGAKLDAGKAEFDMVLFSFPQALAAVNAIGALGAVKYTKGGFLEVPDGVRRYLNADMRHKVKHESGELNDPDTGHLHLAHAAWNAIARLELYLRGKA